MKQTLFEFKENIYTYNSAVIILDDILQNCVKENFLGKSMERKCKANLL